MKRAVRERALKFEFVKFSDVQRKSFCFFFVSNYFRQINAK